MPQDINLDPDLSVVENLIVYGRYFDIRKKDALRLSRALLEFVELVDKGDAEIDQLSGGMKHRLLLARSLVNNPEILVLDEPTTGLDPHSRRAVWESQSFEIQKNHRLLTTHYMEEAELSTGWRLDWAGSWPLIPPAHGARWELRRYISN
jgi:lipooligosaccharide transport system ATP-binding protein